MRHKMGSEKLRVSRGSTILAKIVWVALGIFVLQGLLQTAPVFGQGPEEMQEMKRRIEMLEKATGAPPPIPETSFRVNIRKPNELRAYNPVVCPGFMECMPEPQLQLESPKPAKAPGWELELQVYNRFRTNYYDNFSDTRNATVEPFDTGDAVPATTRNNAPRNGSGASFNTSQKEDDRNRFSLMRGYFTTALKNGPFMAVVSLDYAGDAFNDGVMLGNASGPLGPAGQRQFQVNTQLLYLQANYAGWQLRLGRQMNHVGNGIIGHIPRDSITLVKNWTDNFSNQITYVYGAYGRTINNQAGPMFTDFRGDADREINQSTQSKLNSLAGDDEVLEGLMLITNYNPMPMNRLQFFLWRMFDTSQEGAHKQLQFIDLNGSGRLGRFDYAFELAHMRGTTGVIFAGAGAAANRIGNRDDNRAYLGYLDLRYTLPPNLLQTKKDDLLSLGATFGFGTGDDKPNDGKNANFENLFVDETSFRYNFMYSDDINGFNGRAADNRRASGFTNTTFFQPYVILRPTEKFQTKVAWTYLRATVAQPAGTGVLGPTPVLAPFLSYSTIAVGGPTKDIGQEFDVLMDYFFDPQTRLFSHFGMFLPGRLYAPFADNALKYEMGLEFRF